MEDLVKNKTEVLVFKYAYGRGPNQDMIHYIKGKVVESKLSHDLSIHGSCHYENIYTVLGEDGTYYRGTYRTAWIGNYFILTISDYIKYLEQSISLNNEKIEMMKKENALYSEVISSFKKASLVNEQKVLKK